MDFSGQCRVFDAVFAEELRRPAEFSHAFFSVDVANIGERRVGMVARPQAYDLVALFFERAREDDGITAPARDQTDAANVRRNRG